MPTVENFTMSGIREEIADFPHKDKVIFAVYCAELVIDIYENKNDSKAPRRAIEAAKEWIKNPTEENKKKCMIAYASAGSAADAADAAAADAADDAYAAAAAAAYAAYAAAAAAAYAADAAAAAAVYDAYAASNAAYSVKTKIIDKINEMKNRHDQQVDSGDGYDRSDIIGLPDQPYTPEVGEECETRNFALGGDWQKCKVISMHDTEVWMHLERNPTSNIYEVGFYQFRKLKTEREELLEQAVSDIVGDSKIEHLSLKASEQIEKLIDAGWRPTND